MSSLFKFSNKDTTNATFSANPTESDMLASSPSPVARLLLVLNSPKWSRVGEHFANVIVKIGPTVRINVQYREVQLDLTPEIYVLHMLFESCHSKNRKRSFKQHVKYSNFRSGPLCMLKHEVGADIFSFKKFLETDTALRSPRPRSKPHCQLFPLIQSGRAHRCSQVYLRSRNQVPRGRSAGLPALFHGEYRRVVTERNISYQLLLQLRYILEKF